MCKNPNDSDGHITMSKPNETGEKEKVLPFLNVLI
jgi:hypothetical protein